MTAPFRELFVEVPAVLLEILRAAVEANLPPPPLPRPSIAAQVATLLDGDGQAARALCEQFGFARLVVQRSARDRTVDFIGIRPCRYRDHQAHAAISDAALEDVARSLLGPLIVRALTRATRNPCFCVAQPRGRW
jgi:hypothetical protein